MKRRNEVYLRPAMVNMVEEDGKIWAALLNRNGICEIDKATRRARICKVFEGEPLIKDFLYSNVEKVGNYLVFSPWDAENIAIYDLKNISVTYLSLKNFEKNLKENRDGAKFWNIVRYQSNVYLLGYSYPAIVRINTDVMAVEYITDWVEAVEESIEQGDNSGYFGDGYVVVGDLALLPVGCTNAILELNMKTSTTKLRKLNVSMKGIGGIASADGEIIWLVGRGDKTNRVSCWNRRANAVKEIPLKEEDESAIAPFYAPICGASKVFLMPSTASCIYEINIETGEISKCKDLEMPGERENSLWPYWRTMAPRLQADRLIYLTCDDLGWHEYNITTGELQSYYVYLEEEMKELEKYFNAIYTKQKSENFIFSEMKIPLEYFMDRAGEEKKGGCFEKNTHCMIGRKIYDRICGRG